MKYNRQVWIDDSSVAAIKLMKLKVELDRASKIRHQLKDIHMLLSLDDPIVPQLLQSVGIMNERIERLIDQIEA